MESLTEKQLPLPVGLPIKFTFDNFIVGANSELVSLLRVLALGRAVTHNQAAKPIYVLSGEASSGKTHLLNATHGLACNSGITSTLMEFTPSQPLQPELLQGLSGSQLLLLDNLDNILGARESETVIFDLINQVLESQRQTIVFAMRHTPQVQPFSLPDLQSRLVWGDCFSAKPVSNDHKMGYFEQKAAERGLELPPEVSQFLIYRMPRDMATLNLMIDKLDSANLVYQRKLTIPFVKQVFAMD